MIYYVTKQFGTSGSPTHCGNYKTIEEARAFIQTKLAEDATLNIKNVIYKILEGADEVESYDSNTAITAKQESGSQGRSSSASFNPSPLNNTGPRPAGMPLSGFKDNSDDKKK